MTKERKYCADHSVQALFTNASFDDTTLVAAREPGVEVLMRG